MKIDRLITELQNIAKTKPKAEVRLNDHYGSTALFALTTTDANDNVVWIESRDDIEIGTELEARFEYAADPDNGVDELYFFEDLLDTGFTLEDIQVNAPEYYEYSKNFMEEHGLI